MKKKQYIKPVYVWTEVAHRGSLAGLSFDIEGSDDGASNDFTSDTDGSNSMSNSFWGSFEWDWNWND